MEFSVLMSIYRYDKVEFLREAIDSIINQSFKPSEIVIVQDGPLTTNLEKLVDSYVFKFPGLFKKVSLPVNQGLGVALNEGVKHCTYDIIARMDSDDISKFDRFLKQINVLKSNPEVDIVGSYIDEFETDPDCIVTTRKVPLDDCHIKKYAKYRNPFNHMTVMFKKKSVLKVGNYQSSLWNEDYDLWVRMIISGSKMVNIPESLVLVRAGTQMFKRRGGLKYIQSELRLQRKFLNLKFINHLEYFFNITIRCLTRIVPNWTRSLVYKNFLR